MPSAGTAARPSGLIFEGERDTAALGGIGERMQLAVEGNDRAGVKATQVEACQGEMAAHSGVGCEEHLEAAVEPEAGHRDIGAHASARAIRCFQHHEGLAALVQYPGARQPCEPCADYDNHTTV